MRPLLTSADVQVLDRETAALGTTVDTLMERAGHAVARAAVGLAGGAYGRRAVVVCGKGNNGGDGLVAARYLARWGAGVTVVLLSDPPSGSPGTTLERLRAAGVSTHGFEAAALARSLARADVAIDAILGTGFRGAVEGGHAQAIRAMNESGAPVVAVDVPSGVEGDTGVVRGPAVMADVTVTFGAPKVGNVMPPGATHSGVVEVAEIGFPDDLLQPRELALVEEADVLRWLPARRVEGDKRDAGVVLVVAGSRTMTGAPGLVAQGAYRAGAGLVAVASPAGILPVLQSNLIEATFVPLLEGPAGAIAEAAWEPLAGRIRSFDAVAIGPGLSTDPGTQAFVRRLVAESPIPVAIDADALNAFAGRAGELSRRTSAAVLTPHAREFGRLFHMPPEEVLEDRIGFARKAAAETGCVVLLKGPRTLVASAYGAVRVNPTGSPALATGGTGDVLAGMIGALLAGGCPPADAASSGAYVHGLAGEIAGARLGRATVASDVAAALAEALGRLEGRM